MNNFKVINSNTIIKDLEEENKKLKNKLKFFTYRIKVLQSKVKTYEADILKGAYDKNNYVYRDNCFCIKCEQKRLEADRKKLRSANDLKGTIKLF
jgi:hypothetical protein